MGGLRRYNEDGMNLRRVEARIGEGRGRMVMGLRNVKECRRRPKSVSRKVEENCERLMKVAPGGIPSTNQIVGAKVKECSERYERFEEAEKRLDWVEE
jgi:hypothetical protein